MAGIDMGSAGGKRAVNQEINMIPFIDLLMVTIAFLLITAVWVNFSRINANAQVPGANDDVVTPDTPSKDLHVYMTETGFLLVWKQAGTIVSETRVPRPATPADASPRYDDLAAKIAAEWTVHGGHTDPSDRTQDRCVLHTANDVPFREIVAVMDAVHHAKREYNTDSGRKRHQPAFNLAFAAR
jgi:biopolymer transport protein ExbD